MKGERKKAVADQGKTSESVEIEKSISHYYCKNCNAQVSPTNTFCPNCGKRLSEVGRNIKLELVEKFSTSDTKTLAAELSSSFTIVSSNVTTTGSLINAIPEERREVMGLNNQFLEDFENLRNVVKNLQKQQPFVDLHGSTINAPVYVLQGDSIVLDLNIEDSFNRLTQEIDKSNVDSKIKATAKSKAGELKAELTKENPDMTVVRRIYVELKSLVPVALAAAQLGVIIGKALLGGG